MEKILIRLIVPAIKQEHDMYIPGFLTVRELTELILRAVQEVSGHSFITSGNEVLCLRERNIILDPGMTAFDYDIKNGDHIVLI